MKIVQNIILITVSLLINSCIEQFIPEISENPELLVVEGLITDQPGPYYVKLSTSLPLGYKKISSPVSGSDVWVSDNLGNQYLLHENTEPGIYSTDSASFKGEVGRFYTLHVIPNEPFSSLSYESFPMEMKPVPPIDTLFYEKVLIEFGAGYYQVAEGCRVFLNTTDPTNKCKFFRWEFEETWEIHIPFTYAVNRICWVSGKSYRINIKNTSSLSESKITRFPINYISNGSDRLKETYSMEVHQYSLNEEEFTYWEKVQNITETVGGLYDITPSTIPNNIRCIEDPNSKVLGFFSVSARSSKRIFINDTFFGLREMYDQCISDTIFGSAPIAGLNTSVWILEDVDEIPPYRVVTRTRDCVDCTTRGTNIEPPFWKTDK